MEKDAAFYETFCGIFIKNLDKQLVEFKRILDQDFNGNYKVGFQVDALNRILFKIHVEHLYKMDEVIGLDDDELDFVADEVARETEELVKEVEAMNAKKSDWEDLYSQEGVRESFVMSEFCLEKF